METTGPKYWIAHNGIDIFHYGYLEEGQELGTGQPYLETFNTEEEWATRKTELGIVEEITEV